MSKLVWWMHQLQLTCAALSIWSWVWALSSSSSFCSLLHFALHCLRASWALLFSSSLVLWLSWSKASFSFLSTCSLLWKKQDLWTLPLQGLIVVVILASRSTAQTLNSSSLCSCCSLCARSKDSFWSTGSKELKDVPVSAYYRIQLWDRVKQKTRAERQLKRKEQLLLQLDQEEAAKRKRCSCVFCLTVMFI